jgi:hypothetical protein
MSLLWHSFEHKYWENHSKKMHTVGHLVKVQTTIHGMCASCNRLLWTQRWHGTKVAVGVKNCSRLRRTWYFDFIPFWLVHGVPVASYVQPNHTRARHTHVTHTSFNSVLSCLFLASVTSSPKYVFLFWQTIFYLKRLINKISPQFVMTAKERNVKHC